MEYFTFFNFFHFFFVFSWLVGWSVGWLDLNYGGGWKGGAESAEVGFVIPTKNEDCVFPRRAKKYPKNKQKKLCFIVGGGGRRREVWFAF
jgi:hypothetical protein